MNGSVRSKSRGVWEVRISLGKDPDTGKYVQKSKTVRGTKSEAQAVLRSMIDERAPSRDGTRKSVSKLLDAWLAECERLDLSASTIRTYRSQVEKYIRPHLGRILVTDLSASDLDGFYGFLKKRGLSPKTIRNYHTTVSSALHQAVRWGWTRYNVAENARPPKMGPPKVKAPSVEQVEEIIREALRRNKQLGHLVMFAAQTGMRRGELCALRWGDIDRASCMITVSRSIGTAAGGWVEKTTKNRKERSFRISGIPTAVITLQHEAVCAEAGISEIEVDDRWFVFSPEPHNQVPYHPDSITNFYSRCIKALGLSEFNLHTLRHFNATQLIAGGHDIRTVAYRLGNDPAVTMRTYSHMLDDRDRQASIAIGNLLMTKSLLSQLVDE